MRHADSTRADFYVGYMAESPPALMRWVRRRLIAFGLLAVAASFVWLTTMRPAGSGRFEFGVERSFEGLVLARPFPRLVIETPGSDGGTPTDVSLLLVAPGKHGALDVALPFDQRRVRLAGSLIHREGRAMIEIQPDSIEELGPASSLEGRGAELSSRRGEPITLRGEIVDSKCWFGVMKPGATKPHRACAVRCISGGVPPMLLVRRENGPAEHHLLVDADGQPLNEHVLEFVAEPVELSGRSVRADGLSFLFVDPADIRRP